MKAKIMKCLALVLAAACILYLPVPASAAAQGTDGTELEGMYPGVIPVGKDGVLRLEIGGSTSYILSCVNSEVKAPEPDATQPTEETPTAEEPTDPVPTADTAAATYPEESTAPVETEAADGTVAGIPVAHLALFGGGLVVAVGALVGIHIFQKRRAGNDSEDDENDED